MIKSEDYRQGFIEGYDFGKQDYINNISIAEASIPARVLNILWDKNIRKLGDFKNITEKELYQLNGVGSKGIYELKKELLKFNIELK
jgi:DNA-directed RNA polymerase alpha subunit